MNISLEGLTFYRPYVNMTIESSKDNHGELIGLKDIVSITDTVLSSDAVDMGTIIEAAIIASQSPNYKTISYPNNTNGNGLIKSINISQESDFINKLVYTIVVEVISNRTLNSKWDSITARDGVLSLSVVENLEYPYDQISMTLDEKVYYNKPIIYTFDLQTTCSSTHDKKAATNAENILIKLGKALPSRFNTETTGEYNYYVNNITKKISTDGSASLNIITFGLPVDSSALVLFDEQISQNDIKIPQQYSTRSYRLTFKSIEPIVYDESFNITSIPNRFEIANSTATSVLSSIIGTKTFPTASAPAGARTEPCVIVPPLPSLPANSCYNTTSVSLQKNYSEDSASIIIEQTTQPTNCDLDGYKIEFNKVKKTDQQVYVESFGWNNEKSIIQNFNTKKADTIEYSIDVTDMSQCGTGSTLKSKATDKYTEISESGTVINYTINISNNKCALRVTEHLGTDATTTGTTGTAPE